LVEAYRLTREKRYLDQARRFVDRRGHGTLGDIELGRAYFQDDVPVRQTTAASGHAVRAMYLAAGVVDLAVEDGDSELLAQTAAAMRATLARRTYLTGGMGARHTGEAFGEDWELPSDRAYAETCAGIGAVMANHRLLLATEDPLHADAVERILYNIVATSPAADGRGFFYANPLHQRAPGNPVDPTAVNPRAESSLRAPWFEVSCCPTNLTRTIASLGAYIASTSATGLQIHQWAPATIQGTLADGRPVGVTMTTAYPADGHISLRIDAAPTDSWQLLLRIPAWAEGATISLGGVTREAAPGYVTLDGPGVGAEVYLDLPLAARWTWPHCRIDATRGQVAVERGPLVYALESVDLEHEVNDIFVRTSRPPEESDGQVWVEVVELAWPVCDWPYAERQVTPTGPGRRVALVPYQNWGERGPSTMRVWMPAAPEK
jgi:DUF1680 family protein